MREIVFTVALIASLWLVTDPIGFGQQMHWLIHTIQTAYTEATK